MTLSYVISVFVAPLHESTDTGSVGDKFTASERDGYENIMREIIISEVDPIERIVHLLSDEQEWALRSAQAANRPLLVRGEPGIGKTQLALAAAMDPEQPRPIVTLTVDSRTESRDLLWTFDAVQRLAEAQVVSNIYQDKQDLETLKREIDVRRFVRPGPIWWALDWTSASKQLGPNEQPPATPKTWKPQHGVVVLIDEIDKAESDLPNGLLEAFGMRQFTPQGWDRPITIPPGTEPPLVIVTTNEERVLPDAFIRRCFVLSMDLPNVRKAANKDAFASHLVRHGQAHFPSADEKLLADAADLLFNDRKRAAEKMQSPLPGQAEYLDFLRAIMKLAADGEDPDEVFQRIKAFVFQKSRGTDA